MALTDMNGKSKSFFHDKINVTDFRECHPQKKQQALNQNTISPKPTSTIPIKGQYPTETEKKMAN